MKNKNSKIVISADVDSNIKNLIDEMKEKYPQMISEFENLCVEQYITFIKKQHDYGPSNISMNTNLNTEKDVKLSLMGIVIRLNDKISRLINLIIKNNKPNNESIEDTFLDLSVYGKIALIVMRGKWGK